jgi:hypothetical protein
VSRPTAAFLGVLWRWKKQVRPRCPLIAIHGVWLSPFVRTRHRKSRNARK